MADVITIPMTATTRSRGTLGSVPVSACTSSAAVAHVDAALTWPPVTDATVHATVNATAPSRRTVLGNSYGVVRVEAAAGMGVVPAAGNTIHNAIENAIAVGNDFGRKQGRPPRGEPR